MIYKADAVSRELALQKANVEATEKYEKLLRAIEHTRSSTNGQSSNTKASSAQEENFNSQSSTSGTSRSYMIIGENGMEIEELQHDNALRIKLQSISSLINQFEETQQRLAASLMNLASGRHLSKAVITTTDAQQS
jgi:succinyl-CoA synthetase beta subunit